MENKKWFGEVSNINPKFEDIEIIFISKIRIDPFIKNPFLLFINNIDNEIYYSINSYEFSFLESYNDWEIFNEYQPGEYEFKHLLAIGTSTYFKLNYKKTMDGDLDEFSENEINMLKKWNRESILRKVLNN
jgi:hypothetical protein